MNRLLALTVVCAGAPATTAAAARDTTPPVIKHVACAEYDPGRELTLRVRIIDESPLFDPKALYRFNAAGRWKSVALIRQDSSDVYTVTIPVAELGGRLEYMIQTFDENGNGPARVGSAESPLQVKPSPGAPECEQLEAAAVVAPVTAPVPGRVPTEPARPGAVQEPPAAPPPSGMCAGPDRSVWCSELLWVVGGGILLVSAGAVTAVALTDSGATRKRPDFVRIRVTSPAPHQAVMRW